MIEIYDMPKLESPFVRKKINGNYVVTPEIAEGYEWVFKDEAVLATEKLDGTNVSVVVENGMITSIWNRNNRIIPITGDWRINEALIEAARKEYLQLPDGQHFGEVLGLNVNGNPYGLERHIWLPLSYIHEHLAYKSWGKYPKTYEAISEWFEKDIFSLFMRKRKGVVTPPEGIVFVQPGTGKMAKLRRDMFSWWKYDRHKLEATGE